MTIEEQLLEWEKGNPLHNPDRDECCPDFSCCTGKIAPPATRARFVQACNEKDAETTHSMLMMFLGGMLDHQLEPDEKVHLAGDNPEQHGGTQ